LVVDVSAGYGYAQVRPPIVSGQVFSGDEATFDVTPLAK